MNESNAHTPTSTHIYFDGINIYISPDIRPLVEFLMQIDDEMKSLLKLEGLEAPIRSKVIALFAYLETIRCLWVVYDSETIDEKNLRDSSNSSIEAFIKDFCLTNDNKWYSDNIKRSGKIGAKNLRKLRNSLTHFFSVPKGLSIMSEYGDEVENLSKQTNNKIQSISPQDLYDMFNGAALILLKTWSNDFVNDLEKFKRKIFFVKSMIKNEAPTIVFKEK